MKRLLTFTLVFLMVAGSIFSVKLTMYSSDESKARVLRQVVELYEKDHPDVSIEVVAFPYANYMQKMSLIFLGGNPPDLLETTATYLTSNDSVYERFGSRHSKVFGFNTSTI